MDGERDFVCGTDLADGERGLDWGADLTDCKDGERGLVWGADLADCK